MLREAVLQQSALNRERRSTARPPSSGRCCALVLDVHDRLIALLEHGVAVEQLDSLEISEPVMRARYDTLPGDAGAVDAIGA